MPTKPFWAHVKMNETTKEKLDRLALVDTNPFEIPNISAEIRKLINAEYERRFGESISHQISIEEEIKRR